MRMSLVGPDHPQYETARRVWNGLVDKRPALIAYCQDERDVVSALRRAERDHLLVSIRAGGHQVAGSAVCDGGLVIDVSGIKRMTFGDDGLIRVGAGVTWAELNAFTQQRGLVVPGGEYPTTGVAGVTLGGGLGYLMRRYGLSCDSLGEAAIVTGEGMVILASDSEHPDLMWALRGCGRGIGVVTELRFQAYSLGPQVATVERYLRYEQPERIIDAFREACAHAPDAVTAQLVLRDLMNRPDDSSDGQRVIGIGAVFAGPADQAQDSLAPFKAIGRALLDRSGTVPYASSAPVKQNSLINRAYMKSHFLEQLSDRAIELLLAADSARRGKDSALVVRCLGGAIRADNRLPSAFPHRRAMFNINVHATWTSAELDDDELAWCRDSNQKLCEVSTGGVYLNFAGLSDDLNWDISAAYGESGARVAAVRAKYDPRGTFAHAAAMP